MPCLKRKKSKGSLMFENDKLVSIIIPTYRRSRYIERSIESVLEQTYKNIEIIVVDDNGKDKTGT